MGTHVRLRACVCVSVKCFFFLLFLACYGRISDHVLPFCWCYDGRCGPVQAVGKVLENILFSLRQKVGLALRCARVSVPLCILTGDHVQIHTISM